MVDKLRLFLSLFSQIDTRLTFDLLAPNYKPLVVRSIPSISSSQESTSSFNPNDLSPSSLSIVSRPLPFPPSDSPVSLISPFNPFEDYHDNHPPFLPGNYPSIPASPIRPASPSPPIPPPPPPRQTQTCHEWIHNVEDEPTIGYLSNPVFVRLLPPNRPWQK
jgi:hypothetical protein